MAYFQKQINITFFILFTVFLSACGGGGSGVANVNPIQPSTKNFSHVEMHYKLLNNQAMIWGESDVINHIQLTQSATKGSTTLHINNSANLIAKQLIAYLGSDGNYYVGQIKTIHNVGEIELFLPIKSAINSGINAWDFYQNGSHADTYGFKAIADFAIDSLNFGTTTTGTHLLLGDSWFNEGSIHNRLILKLPNAVIINKGIGGDTTQDLLNRFDTAVTPNAPDYIWILSGTNDYWKGVSTAHYKANLKTLITKSKAMGAKVIIIDSSVGEGTQLTTGIKNQFKSEEYVRVTKELL
jgi:hypothetical protein